jgi:hypothetical protein
MDQEEIQQRFFSAGWSIDGSFSEYLIIGYSGDEMSLLAHKGSWEDDDPVFVILDHDRNLTHFVYGVPTSLQAAKLLRDHGKVADELDHLESTSQPSEL